MKQMFLKKFFPASRIATIRKEICGIRQHFGKTLHEYWERFNKLWATCPHHHISEQLLIQYFYEGRTIMDRSMIDAASGGALMDKTPFGIKGASQPRIVNEIGAVDNLRLENHLTELTSLVRQLVVGQHQPTMVARVCGICIFMEHPTDMCPILQETETDHPESVGAIGDYQYGKQPYQSRPFDKMKQLAISNLEFQQNMNSSNMQFQQNMNATIQDLKIQIGQLANTVSHLQSAGSNNLPSQTIPNPRGNASAVTLRSGKELPQLASLQLPRPTDANSKPDADSQALHQDKIVPLPFPTRALIIRKPKSDEELLRMFWKVEINNPLLDAIKKIPKYAKFLKKLCVHKKKKMKGGMEIGGIVSALIRNKDFTIGAQQALLKKCRDPGIFSVPCTIGDCTFVDAMLDLGASINVMPTSIYKSLYFGDLEPTGMTIQLANRSVVQPLGILEDVLVQVNKLIFLVGFYVLDMEDETSRKGSTLILGRPFLMTGRTKIDVHVETLSMEFGDTLL
ncbi:hypothetical protein CR513_10027, partial [Mucuna pruriens]